MRGEHAHRECHQILICAHGSLRVMVDDGEARRIRPRRADHRSARPADGLARRIPVLARCRPRGPRLHAYDPGDYIRDYEEWLRIAQR
ncbi:MAG: WxcM-like domain-containing protein [Verrucomicrobiales bacterium]